MQTQQRPQRPTGKAHWHYRHGNYTDVNELKRSAGVAQLRNLTDVLLVLGCLSDKKKSSGNLPLAYAEIKTKADCEKYILEQIRLDQKSIDDCRGTTKNISTEGK